jgi:pimeloyl-ACP methyl ester carboxylesterase
VTLISVSGGPIDAEFLVAAKGSPDPTLVLLHEGLGSIGLWRSFPADVSAACGGLATLTYSRHGYGRSGPPELPRPVNYMHHEAEVVLPEVLSAFKAGRSILIGHSDGASIALLYAAAGYDVAGLVLIAPHVFVEDLTIAAIEASLVAYKTTELRMRLARHHDDVDAAFLGWNDIWLSPSFRSWNIEDCLASVTCSILLIQSEADPYGTSTQLDAIESGVQGTITRMLVSTPGHAPHLDAPSETMDAISGFVRSLR